MELRERLLRERTAGHAVTSHHQGSSFHEEGERGAVRHIWEGFFRRGDVMNLGRNDLSLIREFQHGVIERRGQPAPLVPGILLAEGDLQSPPKMNEGTDRPYRPSHVPTGWH
jgi:hypothetical protein